MLCLRRINWRRPYNSMKWLWISLILTITVKVFVGHTHRVYSRLLCLLSVLISHSFAVSGYYIHGGRFYVSAAWEVPGFALAVKNPCHLNMAACLIKLKRYDEAIGHCNIVLIEEEKNLKALFRRGKGKAELGQMESARDDSERHKSILLMARRIEESYEQLQSKRKLFTKSRKKCTKEYLVEGKKVVLRQRAVTG